MGVGTHPFPAPAAVFRLRAAALWLAALLLLTGCAAGRPAGRRADSAAGGQQDRGGSYSRKLVVGLLSEQYSEWEGASYRAGGMSRSGVDCSGFVHLTFRDKFGVDLPRTTKGLSRIGRGVGRKKLAPGDLVFFKTGLFRRHVGIYEDEGRFIHASTSRGVTESHLHDSYWSRAFWQARRVLPY